MFYANHRFYHSLLPSSKIYNVGVNVDRQDDDKGNNNNEGDNDEGNNKFDGKRSSGRIPWTIYNPPEPYVPDVFTLTFPPASPCVSMFIASPASFFIYAPQPLPPPPLPPPLPQGANVP